MDHTSTSSFVTEDNPLSDLRGESPAHPALRRLHERITNAESQQITSYDRMHHRHNRS